MMLRILSDEILSFLLLASLITAGWFKLSGNLVVFIVIAIFFSLFFAFCFLIIKIFAPSININKGNYESCIRLSTKAIRGKYSIIRLTKNSKLFNYYKILTAYAYTKMDEIEKAKEIVKTVDEGNILKGQFIQLRIINAIILINEGKFKKALDSLISITQGRLSQKQVPILFYLISLCYLELNSDLERAMNYATVSYSIKNYEQDYVANYAIALFKFKKDAREAKKLLNEVYENINELSKMSKPRLLLYLYKVNSELGNVETGDKYKNELKSKYPNSRFTQKTI